jgi:SAM-dependent methyltransferase
VPRDLYEPPPPRAVSRRAFLGLRSAPADDRAAERDYEALARAVAPVEEVLRELAPGDEVLELPPTAWRELDPQALPYPDGAFDAAVCAFAPRPRRTVSELLRVLRPGGVVAIAVWTPRSLPGRVDELLDRPGGAWGRQEVMRRRLEPWLEEVELRTRAVQLCFTDADGLAAALGVPTGARRAFDRLLASCNNAADRVEVDARYLIGFGRRPILSRS